jgi:hypothetical protein
MWPSTCRCWWSCPSRCSPARASAPCTPSCLAASAPRRWRVRGALAGPGCMRLHAPAFGSAPGRPAPAGGTARGLRAPPPACPAPSRRPRPVTAAAAAAAGAGRIEDCQAKVLLTSSAVMRATKRIDLKSIADSAMDMCASQVRPPSLVAQLLLPARLAWPGLACRERAHRPALRPARPARSTRPARARVSGLMGSRRPRPCRCCAGPQRGVMPGVRQQPRRGARRLPLHRRPRRVVAGRGGRAARAVPRGLGGGGAPAVPALHLGLHRWACLLQGARCRATAAGHQQLRSSLPCPWLPGSTRLLPLRARALSPPQLSAPLSPPPTPTLPCPCPRQASPRACCTPRAATWSTRPPPPSTSSTWGRATPSGAQRTAAGSRATATWRTVRCRPPGLAPLMRPCLLPAACCLLPSLPADCCPLPGACCPLLTACQLTSSPARQLSSCFLPSTS